MSVAEGFFIAGTIPFALLGATSFARTLALCATRRTSSATDDVLIPALKAGLTCFVIAAIA